MKKQGIKKDMVNPKKIEKLDIKDMKQVKGGFIVIIDDVEQKLRHNLLLTSHLYLVFPLETIN